MINATTDTSASFAPATASTTAAKPVNEQDRFMTLLVAQMKNQDPLNPMDNAQMTSQLAQISTVSGIDKLNVTLQALSTSMYSNQALQATAMIGHGVLVAGSGVDLVKNTGLGGFELSQPADNAVVSIYNQAGELVRRVDLGAKPAGITKWQWDGKDSKGVDLPDGHYTFSVNATQGSNNVAATTLQFGLV
ncbi:MAG: flagellar hook assembly protein FlgD, partial [Gallionellaceae bacterium]|nr:flagellar hook assembly protein FlgD [Gallionellaceae bacterium]